MKKSALIWPVAKTALFGLLLAAIYYSSISAMTSGWKRDDYNYCYLVPFVVIYLVWEKRQEFFNRFFSPTWLGLVALVPGIVLFWLGELGGEYYSLYLSSWLVLVGLIWMHVGWGKLKIIWFPLFFLLTMFPPPNFVYSNLSLKLKLISSQISVAVIQAMGMTAYREGNVIDLGFTQLQVVDACSGLRYLIMLIVLALLLAYFFKAAWWKRIVLMVSAVPISILVNALRIVSVAVLYPIWGAKTAKGFFHDFSGWLIFMASLGILLFEMWLLKKIGKAPEKPATEAADRDTGPGRSVGEKSPGLFQPQFIVTALMLGGTLVLSHGIEFREKMPMNQSFDRFPLQIADWIGRREPMEQKIIDELDLSDYLIVDYRNPAGQSVNFYVAYYESQRKGESIHSPESCLPGGGWVFNRAGTIRVSLKNHNPAEMKVNRALMQKGAWQQLSYFWFPQRDRILTNLYQLKLYNFWDALTRQRTDGALVRLITPMDEKEEVEEAEERLSEFTSVLVPVLDRFLPK
jgi:exosortase D (VPLPA-CTERM-specific)